MRSVSTKQWAPKVFLLATVAARAQAQFAGLSSTDDGKELYFASPLRQRGTDQFLWSKIFRLDSGGVALVAEVARSSPAPPTNAYVLDAPQVSGDGRLLLYTGTLNCGCCSSCFLSEQHSTTLLDTTTGQSAVAGPNARMSRNGRYLASYSSRNVTRPVFDLLDRASSATLFHDSIAPATVSIASDGTTALTVNQSLQLISRGSRTTLIGSNVIAVAIDDGAAKVVYETQAPRRLFVRDLKSAQIQPLGPEDRDSFQATLSADGQWVAWLSALDATPQVFFGRLDGSSEKQLTAVSAGILEATLSGDAKTVFAVAADGEMLRIDTATGGTTTLIGPTPTIGSVQTASPGSLTSVKVSGVDASSVSLSISGLTAPILQRSANQIVFQVPWEVPLTANAVTNPQGGEPYFEDSAPLLLQEFVPEAIVLAPQEPVTFTQPIAIHSDWGSLVTDEQPAAPGETVHIYLTGGGPVNPPVATGSAAPRTPLSPITTPVTVSASDQQPLSVPFFGLAPGLIGVWQMDVTLPPVWSRQFLVIQFGFYSRPPNSYAEALSLPGIPMKSNP
uniref:WD40 domain protein beta Propeller n=1 Tax=Solibacter usitatus (strain Ellin6076) TaxID=234267 RepID=Q01SN5_SOLUE